MSNRTFFVSQIPNSNLLLIVINKINEPARELNTVNVAMTTDAIEMVTETTYGEVHPCHKRYMNFFERRRIDECFVSLLNCCANCVKSSNAFHLFTMVLFVLLSFTDGTRGRGTRQSKVLRLLESH